MSHRPFIVALIAALALVAVALIYTGDQIRRLREASASATVRQ